MAKQETRGNIGTYRRPGTATAIYDPGATILEGIEKAGEAITGRIKTVRDFENAAATRRQETLDSLAETEGMKDFTALDSLQQQLMSEIDELYRLDIASFEGDRSAYLKKQNEMQRVIGDIPAGMGLIDQEAELLKEMEQGGEFAKKFLQSNNEDYYNFIDRASKGGEGVSFRVENGNIIAQLDGKDVFNVHAYIKAKKDGYDLVEYAGDYSKEINAADVQAYKGLDKLVSTEIIQGKKDYTTLSETEKKDYNLAKQTYRERLESGQIALPVNESTYQTFTNYATDVDTDGAKMDKWGKDIEIQSAATREAIIDYMVKQRFPEEEVVTKYKETYQKPPAVDTKTSPPPTPIDPKLKNKLDVNRQLAKSLKGDPNDPNRKYRYGGTVVSGSSIAYHLNQSTSKSNDMKYMSLKQLGVFGKDQDKDNTKKEMYFGEDWEDNPAYKELKNLYDQSIGDSPSLQGLKNVYTWDGEKLSEYITYDMSLNKINDLMDDAYSVTTTDKYVSPQFKERELASWSQDYRKSEMSRLNQAVIDAQNTGGDVDKAKQELKSFTDKESDYKNTINKINKLVDTQGKSIRSKEVIQLFRRLPMPNKKSLEYGRLVKKLNAITDPARQLNIPLNKWNSMSKEQKLKEVAVLMDIDFYETSLIRP